MNHAHIWMPPRKREQPRTLRGGDGKRYTFDPIEHPEHQYLFRWCLGCGVVHPDDKRETALEAVRRDAEALANA